MLGQMDWHLIFVVPMIAGFATRFVPRGWGWFSFLPCILAALIPLVDAKEIGVSEDPVGLFLAGAFLAVLGRFLPDITRWVWAIVSRMKQRWAFVLGLALVLASVLPPGAGQQFFVSITALGIMLCAFRIMIFGPWWGQKRKKKGK